LRGWAKEVYGRFPGSTWVEGTRGHFGKSVSLTRSSRRTKKESSPRILVFRIGQLGDTIVSLPAMWAVRRHFPNAHIALLSDRHPGKSYVLASDLLRGAGIFEEFLSYPVSETGFILRPGRMATLLAAVRRRNFDTLVYLAPSNRKPEQIERDRRFFSLAGIKNFIGMEGFPVWQSKNPGVPLDAMPSESNLLLDRLAVSGIRVPAGDERKTELRLGAKEDEQLASWLAQLQPDGGRPWIAVGPGSKMPAKRWPLGRFQEVVDLLIQEFDIWPVVFGGDEDQAIGEALLQDWGRGYNAAGALGVRAALAALKRCMLFLGNDTGTMHMAAAMGVPCVVTFSSREPPGWWYPEGKRHRIFRSQIECEGCGLIECIERANECLKRISVDEVLDACREMLSQKVASRRAEVDESKGGLKAEKLRC